MNDNQPAAPSRVLLTAKSEYSAAAEQLLKGVKRELRIFDPALTEYALDTAPRIALLRSFLLRNPANRVYIAVHHSEQVKRNCPRVMGLLALFSTALFIHRTDGDAARVQDCFVLADDAQFVRRPVYAQARGVFVRNDPAEASGMRKRFDEIWDSSIPDISASTAGL